MEKPTTLCPFCKTQFDVEEDWIGQQTTCPVCGKDFTILLKEDQVSKAIPQKPVQTPPPPAAVPQAVPVQPVREVVPVQPVREAVPVQPVQKAVPVQPVQKTLPADQSDPTPTGGAAKPNSRRKKIVELCVLACLALTVFFVCVKPLIDEMKRRKEEAARIKMQIVAAREAEEKRQQEEAAKKAAEEKRRQEEAAKKAAEEKRRQEEAARKAEQEKKLSETRKEILAEWKSALKQKKPQKIFLWAPGHEGSQILLFRYDDQLAASIDRALYTRNRLARYRKDVPCAVSAYEKNDLAAVDKLYQGSLQKLEPNADALSKQMTELSEKIAALGAEKELLAGQFTVPADGLVREDISPGKYIAVHLSAQEDCCGYIFLKGKELPVLLELRDGRWYDISEKKAEEEQPPVFSEERGERKNSVPGKKGLEAFCSETQIPGLIFFAELKKNLRAVGGQAGSSRKVQFLFRKKIRAIHFSGDPNQGIRYQWKPPVGSSPRTVSLWFFPEGYNRHDVGNSVFSYGTKDFGKYFDIETNRDKVLVCAWGQNKKPFAQSVDLNKWHHFVIAYDGNTQRCYLDGKETFREKARLQTTPSRLMIGTRLNDTNHCFVGAIRNVAVYDRALSEEEINKIRRLDVNAERP